MNERMKLPPQDWLGYDPERGDIHGYTFEQMREFAELIVRECAEICKKQEYDYWRSSEDQDFTPQDCADAIEQHFGVE